MFCLCFSSSSFQDGLISLTYNCLVPGNTTVTTHMSVVTLSMGSDGPNMTSARTHDVTFSVKKVCATAKVAQDLMYVPGLNIATSKAIVVKEEEGGDDDGGAAEGEQEK